MLVYSIVVAKQESKKIKQEDTISETNVINGFENKIPEQQTNLDELVENVEQVDLDLSSFVIDK